MKIQPDETLYRSRLVECGSGETGVSQEMMIQDISVGVVVIGATYWIIRKVLRQLAGHEDHGGCEGCTGCSALQASGSAQSSSKATECGCSGNCTASSKCTGNEKQTSRYVMSNIN